MENKKLGFLIIGFSIVMAGIMFSYMSSLNIQGTALGCNANEGCERVTSLLGLSHIAVGFLSFVFALGFYLLFFNKGETAILDRLEEDRNKALNQDKFEMMIKPMEKNEKNILKAIKNQEGITQSTLKYRVNLSKATVSNVVTQFEKRNLITRSLKGKTYEIFLRDGI